MSLTMPVKKFIVQFFPVAPVYIHFVPACNAFCRDPLWFTCVINFLCAMCSEDTIDAKEFSLVATFRRLTSVDYDLYSSLASVLGNFISKEAKMDKPTNARIT